MEYIIYVIYSQCLFIKRMRYYMSFLHDFDPSVKSLLCSGQLGLSTISKTHFLIFAQSFRILLVALTRTSTIRTAIYYSNVKSRSRSRVDAHSAHNKHAAGPELGGLNNSAQLSLISAQMRSSNQARSIIAMSPLCVHIIKPERVRSSLQQNKV